MSPTVTRHPVGFRAQSGWPFRTAHGDAKSVTALTDASGAVTSTQERDAFGMAVSSSGDWSTPFQYGGQYGYQTDDTGLQLLGHRFYDPSTGRFLTRDPIKDGPNWYAYCLNDPVNYSDATVLGRLSAIFKAFDEAGNFVRYLFRKQAVERRLRGKNVWAPSKKLAKAIENQVPGRTIHHDAHRDGYYNHYQTDGHPGHTFYGNPVKGGGGAAGAAGGTGLEAVVDLVNPVADVVTVVDHVTTEHIEPFVERVHRGRTGRLNQWLGEEDEYTDRLESRW